MGFLRSHHLIHGNTSHLQITEEGMNALGPDWQPLPTGRSLAEYWLGKLDKAPKTVLSVLLDCYPEELSMSEVAIRTASYREDNHPYTVGTGAFNNAVSRLRTLELAQGRGALRASDTLFD